MSSVSLGSSVVSLAAVSATVILASAGVLAGALARALTTAGSVGGKKPPRDDPRWNAPPGPPQVAGKRCAHCDRRIVFDREGHSCRACGMALHASCADIHGLWSHRTPTGAAYR